MIKFVQLQRFSAMTSRNARHAEKVAILKNTPRYAGVLGFRFLHAFDAGKRCPYVEPLVRDHGLAWPLSSCGHACGYHGSGDGRFLVGEYGKRVERRLLGAEGRLARTCALGIAVQLSTEFGGALPQPFIFPAHGTRTMKGNFRVSGGNHCGSASAMVLPD